MSDEKKYSADYVAKAVLKKAYDIMKSKSDAGLSTTDKQKARKDRSMASLSDPLHTKRGAKESIEGKYARGAKNAPQKDKKMSDAMARMAHRNKLEGIKETPKPNLPKSEEQSSDMKKMKKCGDIQTMKKTEKLASFVNKVAEKRGKKEETNG